MQGSLATKTLSDVEDNSDGETRTRRVVIDENGNEVIVDSDLVYDSDSLPPEVSTNLMSVGTADDNKNRVVVPDQVVDALIDEQPNADTSIIDNALVDAKNQPAPLVISDDLLEPKPSVNVDETIVESGTQVEEEEPQLLITFSYARDELKAVPNRHYTVQLGAMRSLQDVQEFINLHDLDGQVRIYPTIRSEVEWYIITYRDYDTIQKARDAIKNLPSSLQSIGAWAKSMTQVHREIDREK
jgi:DamX protein